MTFVTRVLVLWPGHAWALGDIRLRLPLTVWSEIYGGELRCIPFKDRKKSDIDWASVIVIQREASPALLDNIRTWRSKGKAVIFDIDDLLIDVPSFLKTYSHYQTVAPFIKQTLGAVNHVTTTTDRLLRELRVYTSNISTTPNRSHHQGRSVTHGATKNTVIKLLIASTDTVRLDFIFTALRKVLSFPDLRIEILAIGNTVAALKREDINVKAIPILSYSDFLGFLSNLDNAVGLIPLDASRFSSCKSSIKFLDYAECGIPSICSDVPPYSDAILDGENGLLVQNNAEAWIEAILSLAMSPEQRTKIAIAAKSVAVNAYSRNDSAAAWQFAIDSAISHHHANPIAPTAKLLILLKLIYRFFAFSTAPGNYIRLARKIRHDGLGYIYTRLKNISCFRDF
jgi:O-antigen biosynthesis protein